MSASDTSMGPMTSCGVPELMSSSLTIPVEATVVWTALPSEAVAATES